MPNLPTHFNFALDTLTALNDPSIQSHVGSFLLGSATPDIRALTKGKRSHTHFAPLEVDRVGVGAQALFRSHPHLRRAPRLSGATRSFLAGYISHLVTDETWITRIYQPYFANRGVFPEPVEANVLDRALQLDMDRQAREAAPGMDRIIEQLQQSDRDVQVGFIDAALLSDWRAWVSDFSARPFSWDRLFFLARRRNAGGPETRAIVEDFISSPHSNLQKVHRRVPKEEVKEFRERAIAESARLIREHLNVS